MFFVCLLLIIFSWFHLFGPVSFYSIIGAQSKREWLTINGRSNSTGNRQLTWEIHRDFVSYCKS